MFKSQEQDRYLGKKKMKILVITTQKQNDKYHKHMLLNRMVIHLKTKEKGYVLAPWFLKIKKKIVDFYSVFKCKIYKIFQIYYQKKKKIIINPEMIINNYKTINKFILLIL